MTYGQCLAQRRLLGNVQPVDDQGILIVGIILGVPSLLVLLSPALQELGPALYPHSDHLYAGH